VRIILVLVLRAIIHPGITRSGHAPRPAKIPCEPDPALLAGYGGTLVSEIMRGLVVLAGSPGYQDRAPVRFDARQPLMNLQE
jgi:hypothetical protein